MCLKTISNINTSIFTTIPNRFHTFIGLHLCLLFFCEGVLQLEKNMDAVMHEIDYGHFFSSVFSALFFSATHTFRYPGLLPTNPSLLHLLLSPQRTGKALNPVLSWLPPFFSSSFYFIIFAQKIPASPNPLHKLQNEARGMVSCPPINAAIITLNSLPPRRKL